MIISKQGKFYIGDPCYVLSDEDYHEVWGIYNDFNDGTIDVDDDNAFIVNGTAWGDGQYTDQYGNIYSVDSGTLAIVPIELVSKTDGVKNGKVFEGSKADLDYYDDGVFVFSIDDKNYIIETGDQVTEQEEEEELDERFLGASDAVYKDSIEKGLYSETKDLQEDEAPLKHENFKGVEFEQDIPHRMRFKQYDFVNDNKDLYWITQQVFSEKELLVFLEAFKHTDFDKAYVTVRDFSTYDYNKDINRNVLVVLDKNGIVDSTGYFNKIKDLGWQDLINESKNLHEKLNSYEKITFAKHLLNAETDKDLKKIIDEIRYYSEPTYTKCMSILDGEGSTQYKAGQMSDMLYQLNEVKEIKTEDIDYTYINENTDLKETMEKIYEDIENKLDIELGIKLEGGELGRFNPLYKTAEIKVNDNSYITIRLNYSLPDGIFNYITVYYSVELTTKEGAGQIGDLKYTDSTSTREIAHGSYTAFNEDTPNDIKQTSDTVEECIKMVKDVLDGKIISKKESKQLKTERKKRVASYGEFDNGHVFHSWYDWTDEEAEEKAKQASLNNPEDVFYVAVDDIMNPSTGIVYSNGQSYKSDDITVKYIDGVPTVVSNLDIKEETLNDDEKWKDENPQKYEYMLLDRLRLDCEYYLGNGNRQDKFLWAGNVDGQIAKMKELWYQLNEKPEWLTMEQIEEYAKQMGANELPSTQDNTAEQEINNMLDRSYEKETKVGLEESNYEYSDLMAWTSNLQDYEPSEAWNVVMKETNNKELADDVAETIRVMKQQIGTLFEEVEYITREELDAMPEEYKTTVGKTIRARQFAGDKVDDLKALYTKLGYTEDDPMILTLDSKQGTILKPVKVQEDKVLKTEDEKLGWQDLTQNDIQLYMNTWTNYEENGDNVESINGGWMNIDEAEDFYKQNGENHPIITGIQCEKDLPIIFEEAGNNLENINTLDLIEDIRTFTNSENQEALEAILETEQCTLDEAVERLNDTYFSYYPGVKNSGQLAQAIIREVGGYKNLFANANDILPYFKADELSEILVDKAVDAIFEKYPDIDNMDEIDDNMLEEELDNQVNDYLQRAFNEDNEEAIDAYFDYKAYGDSLEDNYTYTKYGAISI